MGKHRRLLVFTEEGLLPVREYALTLSQLTRSLLVRGGRRSPDWDSAWRSWLVANLAVLAGELAHVGILDIYVDGSFAEKKDHPNDIDGYFVCDRGRFLSGQLERELNQVAAIPCWTWESRARQPVPGHGWKLPMWIKYRVELYPHFGQGTGIVDRFGNELTFPAAFRLSRNGHPKGIIKLVSEP